MIRALSWAPAAAILFAAALPGCKGRRAPQELEVPPLHSAVTPQTPVDRTLPGELAEGTEKAFGLTLPRVMIVSGRYADLVMAHAEVPADQVVGYIRPRVTAEVMVSLDRTVFPRAVVPGQPGVELAIEVLVRDGVTALSVRNLSAVPKAPDVKTDEERWRAAGLKPDGTLIDPTHLQ
jgi:hypothetical protein